MRGLWKKSLALVLSLGLTLSAVPLQVARAATTELIYDDIKYTSTYSFTTKQLSEIEYVLTNEREDVVVELHFNGTSKQVQDMSKITVPQSTLQVIQKTGRKATFKVFSNNGSENGSDMGMEYAWVFHKGKMNKMADINLALKTTSVSPLKLTDPITVNSAAVQMKHTTELPQNTELIIPVDKESDDDEKIGYPVFYDDELEYAKKNSFFLYKQSGSKLTYVTNSKYKMNKDCEFRFGISTGGTYVLTPTNLSLSGSGSSSSGSSSSDSVQLSAYTGTVGIGATTSILIQKPTTGTFTVTSGNPTVAQVIGGGTAVNGGTQYKVQGLSTGVSVITVTSSNGSSTSYTLTVQPTTGWVMIDTLSYQFAPGNIYDYKVTLQGASANEVNTYSSRPHIASVRELRRVDRGNGQVDVYYRITALRASNDPTTVFSSVRGVHSSIRVMVTAGVKQGGVAARNLSYFTS